MVKANLKCNMPNPVGEVPVLSTPNKERHEQTEQMTGAGKSFLDKATDFIIGD